MAAAAFRPESRPPEITQALNDVFWLMFIGIVGTIIMQNITLAIASFIDKTEPQTFPRWYGYLNLWVALLSLPGCVVVVFNDGPLAWHGVFAFYIPGAALTIWLFSTTLRAEPRHQGPAARRSAMTAVGQPPASARRIPGEQGTWVFLLGDMLVFAVFFATFMVERSKAPEVFDVARKTLHVNIGLANTLVLLTSSLFVVAAIGAIRTGARSIAARALLIAVGLRRGVRGPEGDRVRPARALPGTGRAPTTSTSTTSS